MTTSEGNTDDTATDERVFAPAIPALEITFSVMLITVERNVVTRVEFGSSGCGVYRQNELPWSEAPSYVRTSLDKVVDEIVGKVTTYSTAMSRLDVKPSATAHPQLEASQHDSSDDDR